MSYIKIGVAGPVGSGKTALIEALALNFADNTDAKMETFMEALAEENRQGGEWRGYNKLFETNIRSTSQTGVK